MKKDYVERFMHSLKEQRKQLEKEYLEEQNKELVNAAKRLFILEKALIDAGYSKTEAREFVLQILTADNK